MKLNKESALNEIEMRNLLADILIRIFVQKAVLNPDRSKDAEDNAQNFLSQQCKPSVR